MVPALDYSMLTATDKTLSVVEPRLEGEEKSPKGLQIDSSAFQGALVHCLNKSGMFSQVFTQPNADYELRTEIVSQKVIRGLTANAILFVHYALVDTETKELVWKENVVSQYNGYGGDVANIVEGSVRVNLTQFLKNLSEALSSVEVEQDGR
jgi:hypothetical protein